ncbi:polyprenyl synthetase family protein [Microbacterium sp. STN6]|uniref:polyprenyl synthetase family protein n=1 Tax=Microbacterium sp. STN6 TaxID=2995588 RepID=UPI002260F8B7|nr:polyprenyl synthetase family protein [Microbacterium sp. STN6]MCX7522649.1 polyprenyl synthetase family protein [Microbacterium sp. STN6]
MTLIAAARAFAGSAAGEVEQRIEAYLATQQRAAVAHGPHYLALWRAIGEDLSGGKRLRPALVLGTFRALGGEAEHEGDAVSAACAFELLHAAFLLHDDVIDGDSVRRGRPNVAGALARDAAERGLAPSAATAWGAASALLAGDLMLHAAQSFIARIDQGLETRRALLDLLDTSVFVTAAGELHDVAFASAADVPELTDVLEMTQNKTAEYSFASPLRAGAMLAGAKPFVLTALAEYGRLAGIAFQLRDDVLGVYGDEALTGKSVRSDLRNGKATALVSYARGTAAWPELRTLLDRPDAAESELDRARALLEECGARSFVESMMRDYASRAAESLASDDVPEALRSGLRRLVNGAVARAS